MIKTIDKIKDQGLRKKFILQNSLCYHVDGNGNIITYVNGFNSFNPTIIYMAHYDTLGKLSNINDNLGSVVNLIKFSRLDFSKINKNIIVIFTDKEELVDFELAGSRTIADGINSGNYGHVELVVNLELTALGKIIWINNYTDYKIPFNYIKVNTPFNDAMVLTVNRVPAICLGTFDEVNYNQYLKFKNCNLWASCHNEKNSVYSEEDTDYLVDILTKFL